MEQMASIEEIQSIIGAQQERISSLESSVESLKQSVDFLKTAAAEKDEELKKLGEKVLQIEASSQPAVTKRGITTSTSIPKLLQPKPSENGIQRKVSSASTVGKSSSAPISAKRPLSAPNARGISPAKNGVKGTTPKAKSEEPVIEAEGGVPFVLQSRKFTVWPPTGWTPPDDLNTPPTSNLQLEYVYGYRGKDMNDNVFWLPDGRIVFFTAAVGVIYDPKTNVQEFLLGHTDDIISLAVHPGGGFVATGQIDPKGKTDKPFFAVWDLATKQQVGSGKNFHDHGIVQLNFNKDGERVFSCGGEPNDHMVALWNWRDGTLLCSAKSGPDKILASAASPTDDIFVTSGSKAIFFWSVDENGKALTKKKGIFGKRAEPEDITALAFAPDGSLIAGSLKTGTISVWDTKKGELKAAFRDGHAGAVYGVRAFSGGVLSAGRDGKLSIWTTQTKGDLSTLKLHASIQTKHDFKALHVTEEDRINFVLGTVTNKIVHMSTDKNFESRQEKVVLDSHFAELWGLAIGSGDLFVTAGDDKIVRVWNASDRRLLAVLHLPSQGRCAAFSPDGAHIAVGTKAGELVVLKTSDWSSIYKRKERKSDIMDIKYSADGALLAIASHDNFIDLFDGKTYKKLAVCKGHSSFVTHIDFSADGAYLQSNSGDYELLFWETATGKQVANPSTLRDVKWLTFTCVLGWPVSGVWPPDSDGTDVNAVSRSNSEQLVVIGTDDGLVNLSRFPSLSPGLNQSAPVLSFVGHSSHVTNARFTADDKRVISVGGNDNAVFQWLVV
mmetsp:Transcript_15355/g.25364  ORF Transcript_15355/g.25364 Transcript_15355/m.25364 type:complete len:781 (-) Transcript_15355:715-3057(-)